MRQNSMPWRFVSDFFSPLFHRQESFALRSLREHRTGQVPVLDGLRVLAITLVIAAHSKYDFVAAGGKDSPAWIFDAIGYGWIGVDLFFVLSGFLIGKLLLEEFQRNQTIQVFPFILRRGLRIWPLYYFICLVMLTGLWFTQHLPEWKKIIPDLLLITNFYEETLAYGSWSLSLEEQFYLIIPFALLALKGVLTRTPSRIPWLFAGLLLLAPVLRLFHWDNPHTSIFTRYDGLVMGLFLASVSVYAKPSEKSKLRLQYVLGGLVVLTGVLTYFYTETFQFLLLAMTFGFLTWHSLSSSNSPFARLLSWPGFRILSRLSYGMYLWYRFPLWRIAHGVVGPEPIASPYVDYLLIFALTFAFAVAAAFVTYVFIEAPFLALRHRMNRGESWKANQAKIRETGSPAVVAINHHGGALNETGTG